MEMAFQTSTFFNWTVINSARKNESEDLGAEI
jgi:hypothetical protein